MREENLHEISGVAFWSVDLLRFAHVFSVSVMPAIPLGCMLDGELFRPPSQP